MHSQPCKTRQNYPVNYETYQQLFDEILDKGHRPYPYNNEAYLNYTKLNRPRMKRWDKQLILDEQLAVKLKALKTSQHWIIITEPWCGDAAHSIPFLIRMAEQNNLITYDIQLRDSEPFLIESYLTNGTKSIPKLIARDSNGNDLFTWGPRPKPAQELRTTLMTSNTDLETTKIALQHWYNEDKGESLHHELTTLLSETLSSKPGTATPNPERRQINLI